MTKVFSAASLYANLDRMNAASLREWLDWHRKLKYPPRYVVLFSAARFYDTPKVLQKVHDELPETTIVWRGYDGRDPWGYVPLDEVTDANFWLICQKRNIDIKTASQMWVERRVLPFANVLRQTGTVVHLLNEADPKSNAEFEAACIEQMGEEGVRAGAFAWAAGTPDWPDYQAPQIEAAVRAAARHNTLVMVHEYAGAKVEEQNSLINRYSTLLAVYTRLGLPQPEVLIGELAACKARVEGNKIILDPDVGWRGMPLTDTQYVDFLHTAIKNWYLPKRASAAIFDWAGWGLNDSFGLRGADRLLDTLRALLDSNLNFEVDNTPAPLPVPDKPAPPVEIPTPAPLPAPETPTPAPQVTTRRYALEFTASAVQHAQIENALLDVLEAVAKLGQALGGATVKIVTSGPVSPLDQLPPEAVPLLKLFSDAT